MVDLVARPEHSGTSRVVAPRSDAPAPDAPPVVLERLADLTPDVVFVAVLGLLGIAGFRTVYGGWSWLIAGGAGLAAGIVIGVVGRRRRLDALIVALLTLVTYFALSGLAISSGTIVGFVPTLSTFEGAANGAVFGWAELLTTLPPVGRAGNLGVVPMLCGLVAGVLATTAALRTRGLLRPLLPLVALLIVGILFGTEEPASLLLQGAAFGAVTIGWVAFRRRGRRASAAAAVGRGRVVGAVAMLVLAAFAATLVGDHLPGADSHERFVLREQTEPPFDPLDHPSPLASFRRYKDDAEGHLRDTTIFTVSGMPEGVPLRLAVMDDYDGVVWRVASGSEDTTGSSGVFQRVGETIPIDADPDEESSRVRIAVGEYDDIWLPDLGHVTGIQFGGARATELAEALRFNRTTGVGAIPLRLSTGDEIIIDAHWSEPVPQVPVNHPYAGKAPGATPLEGDTVPQELKELAEQIVAAADTDPDPTASPTTPTAATEAASPGFDRALRLAQTLIDGPSYGYCDALSTDECSSVAGHSLRRMRTLADDVLESGLTYGNGEQYASAMALMARSLGIPARVVMGFCPSGCPGDDVEITGKDVAAWVEVDVDGVGWVPLNTTPDPDKELQPVTPKPKPKPDNASQPPPPPVTTPPPEEIVADDVSTNDKEDDDDPLVTGTQLAIIAGVLLPFLLIGGFVGGVTVLKRRRRQRRRGGPEAMSRIVGGWAEFDDRALDLGKPLPGKSTRREIATYVGGESAFHSARIADAAIFGPSVPSDAEIEEYWTSLDAAYEALATDESGARRLRADLNPASLLRSFRRDLHRRALGRRARSTTEPGAPAASELDSTSAPVGDEVSV